jgi:hypothetical protein
MTNLAWAILGAVAAAIQATLTWALARAKSGAVRGGLLFIKFPLWAGFFIALAGGGTVALCLGGGVALLGYLGTALWWMKRMSR